MIQTLFLSFVVTDKQLERNFQTIPLMYILKHLNDQTAFHLVELTEYYDGRPFPVLHYIYFGN